MLNLSNTLINCYLDKWYVFVNYEPRVMNITKYGGMHIQLNGSMIPFQWGHMRVMAYEIKSKQGWFQAYAHPMGDVVTN